MRTGIVTSPKLRMPVQVRACTYISRNEVAGIYTKITAEKRCPVKTAPGSTELISQPHSGFCFQHVVQCLPASVGRGSAV